MRTFEEISLNRYRKIKGVVKTFMISAVIFALGAYVMSFSTGDKGDIIAYYFAILFTLLAVAWKIMIVSDAKTRNLVVEAIFYLLVIMIICLILNFFPFFRRMPDIIQIILSSPVILASAIILTFAWIIGGNSI